MDPSRVHPGMAPAVSVEMGHGAGGVYPPLPANGHAVNQQQLGGHAPNSWTDNDTNTLLVVAALITTLTYQLGTNIPGGYWQDTLLPGDGKQPPHLAGDPIMRDLHLPRYWVFMCASWVGFGSSMVMTLSLLLRMPVESFHVRWSFVVAYSSLVLTFIVSQHKTHLSFDIIIWVAVLAFLWLIVSFRPHHRTTMVNALCCNQNQAN